MKSSAQRALTAGMIALATACQSLPQAAPTDMERTQIRGLVIQNRSYAALSEVMLLVLPTREFVSCGNIPIRGQCATTFPVREYQGNEIEIRWREGGGEWFSDRFRVERRAGLDYSMPVRVRVVVSPAGTAVTELVQ
jgi:hypothetical protein